MTVRHSWSRWRRCGTAVQQKHACQEMSAKHIESWVQLLIGRCFICRVGVQVLNGNIFYCCLYFLVIFSCYCYICLFSCYCFIIFSCYCYFLANCHIIFSCCLYVDVEVSNGGSELADAVLDARCSNQPDWCLQRIKLAWPLHPHPKVVVLDALWVWVYRVGDHESVFCFAPACVAICHPSARLRHGFSILCSPEGHRAIDNRTYTYTYAYTYTYTNTYTYTYTYAYTYTYTRTSRLPLKIFRDILGIPASELAHVVVLVVALQKGWSFQSRAAFGIQDGLFKARQQWQTLESAVKAQLPGII